MHLDTQSPRRVDVLEPFLCMYAYTYTKLSAHTLKLNSQTISCEFHVICIVNSNPCMLFVLIFFSDWKLSWV